MALVFWVGLFALVVVMATLAGAAYGWIGDLADRMRLMVVRIADLEDLVNDLVAMMEDTDAEG